MIKIKNFKRTLLKKIINNYSKKLSIGIKREDKNVWESRTPCIQNY
jgi:hypothetical protein